MESVPAKWRLEQTLGCEMLEFSTAAGGTVICVETIAHSSTFHPNKQRVFMSMDRQKAKELAEWLMYKVDAL